MEFRELVYARRAVNHFDPNKDVPEELLNEAIELAAQAPSSFNLQPWSLVILRDLEKKKKLRALAWNQPKVSEAPVVLMVLGDRDGWKEGNPFMERDFKELVEAGRASEEKRDEFLNSLLSLYGENEEKSHAFACKNAGFFAMNFMLAAKSLGLDTHPMDGFDHQAVREAFNIPENYWIICLIAVGHFDQSRTMYPPNWRKSLAEIVVDFS